MGVQTPCHDAGRCSAIAIEDVDCGPRLPPERSSNHSSWFQQERASCGGLRSRLHGRRREVSGENVPQPSTLTTSSSAFRVKPRRQRSKPSSDRTSGSEDIGKRSKHSIVLRKQFVGCSISRWYSSQRTVRHRQHESSSIHSTNSTRCPAHFYRHLYLFAVLFSSK